MSETATLLRATADRLFDAQCAQDLRARTEAGEWPAPLWGLVSEMGLDVALVPEALGGSEASLADAAAVMRAAGRHALPLPLVETMLGNWLLAQTSQPPDAGPVALLTAGDEPALALSRRRTHSVVNGTSMSAPWARHATRIVAVARDVETGRQFVVQFPARACAIRPSSNQAGEPRDHVVVDAVRIDAHIVEFTNRQRDYATLLLHAGAMARCQQMAGALEWIFDRCCSYAGERVQFGKPVASFQAVQHMVAIMATQVSAAAVAADAASAACSNDITDPVIGYAKARVGEAAGEVAALAHQLHGAMGYSHEYPLHWRTRRLWAWRDEFGGERFWNLRAGKRLAERGATQLWSDLTN